jgi:DNA polymerase
VPPQGSSLGRHLRPTMPVLVRDIETRSPLDLRVVGAFRYSADPRTEVLCVGYAIDAGPVKLWRPGEPVPAEWVEAARDPDWLVAAHNDAFETSIEAHILAPRHSWPLVPIERHRCTMAVALAHSLPASLEGAAKALGLRHQKDAKGRALMLQMSKPRRPRRGEDPRAVLWFNDLARLDRLYAYCRQDVEAERELLGRLRPLCPREQTIWELDARINQRGIAVDRKLAKAAQLIVDDALADLDREIAELTGGAVTKASQVARIAAWAATQGVEVSSLAKGELGTVLAGKLPAPVRRVLGLRLEAAQASTKKLAALLASCGDDGRVRGSFIYHKASTGRWAGAGVQPQNLKKLNGVDVAGAIKAIGSGDHRKIKIKFGAPLALVGSMSRPMFIAARGCRFIGADFSGIEARVLAWLANEETKLAAFRGEDRGGLSVYARTAGKLYGRDPATIAKDSSERAAAKICELAFGFLGGLGSFRNFEKGGRETGFSDAQIERFKNTWRAAHPDIVKLGHRLNAAANAAVWTPGKVVRVGKVAFKREGCFLWLRLPSSRKIAYPFPRLVPAGRPGEFAVVFKDNSEGQWRDCRGGEGAWPGTWSENVTQAVARDLLAEAMHRLEGAGYPIVLHAHDEALAEVRNGRGSVDEFREIFTTLPAWAEGLPIAADVFEADRYVKN